MMAGVRIDSPLMSRNIVEIFDIIESVHAEQNAQTSTIDLLADMLSHFETLSSRSTVDNLLSGLRESAEYCSRLMRP